MGFVRVAPLALFFLATSILVMFSMKNIEAVDCSGACSPASHEPPCGSSDCRCFPVIAPFVGTCYHPTALSSSVAKMIDEDPNLCESDEECIKKGTGNFCARYPNHYVDYGWCFNSGSDELKGFLAMPTAISK
ncbi:hypothetical protein PHAVU_011G204400 [Phaseolus vulgaris]|uniref:Albumin I chain a domain-containing protein n=1 Tax=Phaseolus vulgaris TaxID=3885 RepID=V7AKE7_PHAVU|nr:hypothetical protein PHAVU_011G204400g [Phaseolus vulgaris]ESW05725.1 hypothetical protein PHAVU_011G204400g [Phaseolus vulgaris]